MAKKVKEYTGELIVDRLLLIGVLLAATSYIVKGTWPGVFLETGAIVVGILWSARAMLTHPSRVFRLLAMLILLLLSSLLVFYIGSAQGLLGQVKY